MSDAITVQTTAGPVRGSTGTTGDGVATFLAVPYAAPPFGELRFAPPAPPVAWTEPRDCTRLGATAPKPPYRAVVRDLLPEPTIAGDDCLHVNVWTPVVDGSEGLAPVLVWIHGGSFQNGSNAVTIYDGSAFARDGVVLVSVNYRLGVDGFARLAGAPDNRGLLDQIAALEWVRDEIAAFGGDPTRVTVCGESAGAMGVTTLCAMPAARGLFSRVIAQSGAGHHVVSTGAADAIAARLAELLGIEPTAEAFAGVPLDTLLDAHLELVGIVGTDPDPTTWGEVAHNMMPFEPVIDGVSLLGLPYDEIAAGRGADVEVLIGWNAQEHGLFLHPLIAALDEQRVRLALAFHGAPPEAYDDYATLVGDRPYDIAVAGLTDWFFVLPAIRLTEARLALGRSTHVYEFAWKTPAKDGLLGACHALEIGFSFDTLDQPAGRAMTGDDPPQQLADEMHAAWVGFATDGDPGWPAYGEQRTVRRFDGPDAGSAAVVDDPEPRRRLLWPDR